MFEKLKKTMTEAKHKCYRHQEDHGWDLEKEEAALKASLCNLKNADQTRIENLWSLYESIPSKQRPIALNGILTHSCFPELSFISYKLLTITKVDFIGVLPKEVSLAFKFRSSQVSKKWAELSNDDQIWKRMCSQHINRKCEKCGWGLPLMTRKLAKRGLQTDQDSDKEIKKQKLDKNQIGNLKFKPLEGIPEREPSPPIPKKSWKQIYAERSVVARNWRTPKYTTKNLIGHSDGVMSIYYDEVKSLLASGSVDNTLRLWNAETGICLAILKGHTNTVRAVQFDDWKIVSCSLDKTIRVWNLKTFECVRVIEGHTAGVISIHFIDTFLASGAMDGIIRVWNLQAGTSFTLVGHRDWANKVMILPCKANLLSCSDDGTTILWDIASKTPIRTFVGHGGNLSFNLAPVQSLSLLETIHNEHGDLKRFITGSLDHTIKVWDLSNGHLLDTLFGHEDGIWGVAADSIRVASVSQDHTVKVWDLHSGKCLHTFKNHQATVRAVWLTDTKLITADSSGFICIRDFLNKI